MLRGARPHSNETEQEGPPPDQLQQLQELVLGEIVDASHWSLPRDPPAKLKSTGVNCNPKA